MCRNIKTLFNFEPPVTDEEIRAAALQFVRKLTGFNKPSQANEAAFDAAVERTAEVARDLLDSLVTAAAPRNREVEAAKARTRGAARFGKPAAGAARGLALLVALAGPVAAASPAWAILAATHLDALPRLGVWELLQAPAEARAALAAGWTPRSSTR